MVDFDIATDIVEEDIAVISVKGFLDQTTADKLYATLKDFFNRRIYKFIVDLSELTYMGSAGIAVFISILDILNQNEGTLVFVQPGTGSTVQESLKMFEISTVYPVTEDRASALARLKMLDSIKGK